MRGSFNGMKIKSPTLALRLRCLPAFAILGRRQPVSRKPLSKEVNPLKSNSSEYPWDEDKMIMRTYIHVAVKWG